MGTSNSPAIVKTGDYFKLKEEIIMNKIIQYNSYFVTHVSGEVPESHFSTFIVVFKKIYMRYAFNLIKGGDYYGV